MTDLQTRADYAHKVTFPEWLAIEEMDRARKVAEDADQIHDRLAAELGFERVRPHLIREGDVLFTAHSAHEVKTIAVQVDPSGFSHLLVSFTDGETAIFYDGEFVSRQLPVDVDPDDLEPF